MKVAFPDLSGGPALTVVGVARSVTRTADAWVVPAQMPALTAPGSGGYQMLYRFTDAGTAAQIGAGGKAVTASLPRGRRRRTVLAHRQEERRTRHRRLRPLPRRLRRPGPGHVGAHRRQRRRVGRRHRNTPHRHPQGRRLHPGPGRAGLRGPGADPGRRRHGPRCPRGPPARRPRAGRDRGGLRHLVPGRRPLGRPGGDRRAARPGGGDRVGECWRAGRLRTVDALAVGRNASTGRGRRAVRLAGRLPLPQPVALGLARSSRGPAARWRWARRSSSAQSPSRSPWGWSPRSGR